MLVFNNGGGRPDGSYSSVDELELPVDARGNYTCSPGSAYGPEKPAWSYTAPKKSDFFAVFISGAARLPNGNTLICSGPNGVVFEVTPEKETVWKYANPTTRTAKGPAGLPPKGMGMGSRPGEFEVLPGFVRDQLKLSEEQQKDLDAFQKEARARLDKLLSDDQKKRLKDPKAGFGAVPRPGEVMTSFQQARLKLSADQKKEIEGLQKETDTLLEKSLTEAQRKQLKEVRDAIARGGFGPPGGFGGPNPSSLFRAYRYPADYAGLAGRTLTPGKTVEELERKGTK
jgi:hypothetical protein